MKSRLLALAAAGLVLAAASTLVAAPIVYSGQLLPGVPTFGVNTQAPSNQTNPLGANYYFFTTDGVSPVTIAGDRLAGHYDMSWGIWSGLYNDTNQLTFFGANFIAYDDDEDLPNIVGPFGDPHFGPSILPAGIYTLAVTNFLSSAGPPNPFVINATGVTPEPASIMVWSLIAGIGGAGAYFRRRRQTA